MSSETSQAKSPGQIAYEADVAVKPNYHDGSKRRPWRTLDESTQHSWERCPKPRWEMDDDCHKIAHPLENP